MQRTVFIPATSGSSQVTSSTVALPTLLKLFAFSIVYLFALFATLLAEVVVHAVAPSIW